MPPRAETDVQRRGGHNNVLACVLMIFMMIAALPVTSRALSLPRIDWEGGPAYWQSFSKAVAAGWTDPSFFPIAVWYESVIEQSNIDMDKQAGINTYMVLTANSELLLLEENGMCGILQWDDWLSSANAPGSSAVVGWFVSDEIDMFEGPSTGFNSNQAIVDAINAGSPGDGRFKFANYGKGVMMWESDADAQHFVNGFTDAVSVDMYYYTDPYLPGEAPNFLGVPEGQVRLSANYGNETMDNVRRLDAMDGRLQPVWNFIEDNHPFTEYEAPTISTAQISGAVWNSIIHEARGIIYFNHNFSEGGAIPDPLQGSQHVLRDDPGLGIREIVTAVNARIKELAPVLNTQSYKYAFNNNLDTMLKEYAGSVYVFAMLKRGVAAGAYTFTLPAEVSAVEAQVLYEGRTRAVINGQFTDDFAAEHTCHIYKITPPSATQPVPAVRAREMFLSPGIVDGINDIATFGTDAQEVTIYDLKGREYFHAAAEAGTSISWNCRNAAGDVVPAGAYIARIRARDGSIVYQKFAVIK